MHTMKGTIQNGSVMLSEPINGWEGQQVLITILDEGDDATDPTLEEVVAEIRSLDSNPGNVIQPTESLTSLLADAASETPIDSAAWNQKWAAIEGEMKTRDLADDRTEGRR